jgi:CPA2 family monovalent cation:H+ antiporter-2
MLEHAPLIGLLVAGFAVAFGAGVAAQKLHLSPIVGYLAAGIVIGPFTPGFVGDAGLAHQLSEIGVILLMFGVGLHFSIEDLIRVRGVAIPGALLQVVAATAIGTLASTAWGWSISAGLVFGLSLSVSSTVVLLRALEDTHVLRTRRAQVVIGWLIVEDVATVLALVLLPVLAHFANSQGSTARLTGLDIATALGITFGKIALFTALMLVVGRRVIPKLLQWVAAIRSRELFTLAVLAGALGVAFISAELFGVSIALGAFFAGIVLSESDLSHRAGADILPLRDAFAVLFFVSVGMLFDWHILVDAPWRVLEVVGIVVVWKFIAALVIVVLLKHPIRTALTVAAGDSQIGEFSFILIALGLSLGLLPDSAQTLVLAASIASIAINPFVFALSARLERSIRARPGLFAMLDRSGASTRELPAVVPAEWRAHTILIGHGRVGSVIAAMLEEQGMHYVVVEVDRHIVSALTARGVPAVVGDIADPYVEASVRLKDAGVLLFAIPDSFQLRHALEQVRAANPALRIIARTHTEDDVRLLEDTGVDLVVMGERELARRMGEHAIQLARESSSRTLHG